MNYKNDPNTKTEVFNLRMNKATRKKLEEIASIKFDDNKSDMIRYLINVNYDNKG